MNETRCHSRCPGRSAIASRLVGPTIAALASLGGASFASAQLTGETGAHDPSTLTRVNSKYVYFATGQGIASRSSNDLTNWSAGPSVFSTQPSWTTTAVPGFTGFFWAPDVAFMNNQYYLYYSVSTWGSKISAIGLATSPTLDPNAAGYAWTDRGAVIQSNNGTPYNAIDPSIFQDTDGRAYMAFGSYSNGTYITEVNPTTGLRLNTSVAPTRVAASSNVNNASTVEGTALIKKGSNYYLFVNYGGCCAGVDSTYNIRVGRSTSPTGPFLDKNGVNLVNAGGTMFLDDDGNKIGPGHFSAFSEAGQDKFGYHYYDGNRNGAPTYGLHSLYWTADGWPSYAAVNPNWTGTSSAAWSSPGSWSDTVPDAPGAIANFKSITSGRYSIVIDGSARTLGSMNFDSAAGYLIGNSTGNGITLDQTEGTQATINVATGVHTIAAPIIALDQLGINITPLGAGLTLGGAVTAPSLQTYGNGTLTLAGANTYSGSALIHDGTTTITGSMQAGQYMSVAAVVGDTATLRVINNGSLTALNDLNIGDTGDGNTAATGTLEISGNATVTVGTAGGFFVGSGFSNNTRAIGTVNQTGGTLTVNNNGDGFFILGGRTSTLATGDYNLSGGVVNANTNVRIGGRGTGTFDQTGGDFNTNKYVSIGRFSGANGTWTISAGNLNHTGAATQIIVGEAGAGTLNVSGTALVSSPSALRLGHAGGTGNLNLNGGTLAVAAIQRGTGTANVKLNGGTIRPTVASTTFMQGLTSATVSTGGGTFNTNGVDITIAQPLMHDGSLAGVDGGLTKTGSGVLTLSGANTYTGVTTITGGTLRLAAAAQNVLTNAGGLDVRAGVVLFDYSTTSPAETIRADLAMSYAADFHAGQIRSTTAGSGDALGWKVLSATQVEVARTKFGDANLDLSVNFDDLLTLAQNYGMATGATWAQGDFNYDQQVSFDDLLALAQQYGTSATISADEGFGESFVADWNTARSLVPEPTAGLLTLALPMLARQRRGVRLPDGV